MKAKIDFCDFCFTKQEDFVNTICPFCGYPMKGHKTEQEQFISVNEKSKQTIDEAETALSQARFAMLWPSLTGVLLSFGFSFPPQHMLQFAITLAFYSIFILAYFLVAWRPRPILILTSTVLLTGILFSMAYGIVPKMVLVVPGVILLIYINAIYSAWRAEKVLDQMSRFQLKKN